jgi:hypothetical protein
MKVKNIYSSELFEKQYERNDEPSLTIPDQTLSIKQILERYASGQSLEGKTPYYDESESDEYYPDPRYMDLAEREELSENYREEIQYIKTKAQKRKQKVSDETSESE